MRRGKVERQTAAYEKAKCNGHFIRFPTVPHAASDGLEKSLQLLLPQVLFVCSRKNPSFEWEGILNGKFL